MDQDEKEARKRLAEVRVVLMFSVLNLVLLCVGATAIISCGAVVGFNADPVIDVWLWVFAFPCNAASALGWDTLGKGLLFVNPFIYGAMWWFMWKMVRLLRTKPTDDESPPPHPE